MTALVMAGKSGRTWPVQCRDVDGAIWPITAIAVLLLIQITMVFTHAVNWDESLHYGVLVDLAEGRPVSVLQSLYLRPYVWIAAGGNAIDNIIVARIGQWLCQGIVLAMVYLVARRFADRTSAVLAALCYLSAGYVLQNGFALRADPMVAAVLMTCLVVLLRCPLGWPTLVFAGVLGGLAPMLSIKAVLYAPVFAGVLWLRWREGGATLARIALFFAIALVSLAAIHTAHALALGTPDGTAASLAIADTAAQRMFFIGRPSNLGALVYFILTAIGTTVLIAAAPFAIARHSGPSAEKVALAGLLLPALTPLVYENTAPYFYVFMLPPVAAACGVSIFLARRIAPAMAIAGLLFAFAVPTLLVEDRAMIDRQRRLAVELDSMWDRPVAYFDHADVAPTLLKRNPFQTPWGYRGYLERGVPIYREAMERETVPLFVPNWWTFRALLDGNDELFLPEDVSALRENYIPFNGPIWLAGKQFAGGTAGSFEFLVPGPYTVRGGDIRVDGEDLRSGEVIVLDRGHHTIEATGQASKLVWGNRIAARDSLDFNYTWVPF